jgi:hypothetical protein
LSTTGFAYIDIEVISIRVRYIGFSFALISFAAIIFCSSWCYDNWLNYIIGLGAFGFDLTRGQDFFALAASSHGLAAKATEENKLSSVMAFIIDSLLFDT